MDISTGVAVRETSESAKVITVNGDVDRQNAAELQRVLESGLTGSRPIIVDLTRCRYIGSAGMRVLLRAQRKARSLTTLVEMESIVAQLLEIAQVQERLSIRYVTQAGEIETAR